MMKETYLSNEQLFDLSSLLMQKFDDILGYLSVDLDMTNKMYVGKCPVHGGDRHNALNIFHSGDSITGNWICHSQHCETTFVPSIIGFIRGILSHRKYNWENYGDDTVSFIDNIKWC